MEISVFKWIKNLFCFLFSSKEKEKNFHMEEFLLAKKMEHLLTLKSAKKTSARSSLCHLGKSINFSNWFECSPFFEHVSSKPTGKLSMESARPELCCPAKKQVQKQNIRVSETSSGPCNWDPGLHHTQLSVETSAPLFDEIHPWQGSSIQSSPYAPNAS